tara:strand:+ start:373 stop:918 length:546 start_codon:yes stop_codon:yes gene_type:complete
MGTLVRGTVIMVKIINNACHQSLLDFVLETAANRESWHYKFPMDTAFHNKHPKMDIVADGIMKDEFLAGIASSILVQIWELNDRKQFIPEIFYCGISIKDKHRRDNIHVDDENRTDTIKIMGILNYDWNPETMGGGFMHGGVVHKLRSTDFCIFDPRTPHAADEILCDDKRFALDFSVKKT